jgi:hypothetical protein
MIAHELLRQAALLLGAGWSKGSNARDATGRIVPLYVGNNRAQINSNAVAFSPYGAICKVAADNRSAVDPRIWTVLAELALPRANGAS